MSLHALAEPSLGWNTGAGIERSFYRYRYSKLHAVFKSNKNTHTYVLCLFNMDRRLSNADLLPGKRRRRNATRNHSYIR